MATVTITIQLGCTPNPSSVTVSPGDILTFVNSSGLNCTIQFAGPSPCGRAVFHIAVGGSASCTVNPVVTRVTCPYTTTCNPSGDGIIIVDPGTGGTPPPKHKPKMTASAKPAAKRPKAKPKAKSKAKPKGKSKAKGGKKTAPKRTAGKGRSKKKKGFLRSNAGRTAIAAVRPAIYQSAKGVA